VNSQNKRYHSGFIQFANSILSTIIQNLKVTLKNSRDLKIHNAGRYLTLKSSVGGGASKRLPSELDNPSVTEKPTSQLRPEKNNTSVSDYMGSQNRVGCWEFFIFFC
jgi:hypothetical protein